MMTVRNIDITTQAVYSIHYIQINTSKWQMLTK